MIGADTIVVGPSGPLGKPGTPERAQAMLDELRGLRHTVLTGICVIVAQSDREALGLGRSAVKMHEYSDEAVHTYVNSGEPLDRAGAYAIQGGGGDLVDSVSGRIDTVVGPRRATGPAPPRRGRVPRPAAGRDRRAAGAAARRPPAARPAPRRPARLSRAHAVG